MGSWTSTLRSTVGNAVGGALSAPFLLLELRQVRSAASAAATNSVAAGSPSGLLAAFRLPLPPTDARLELDPSTVITRTQGGVVREHSGPRVRRITFQGEVGRVSRVGTTAAGETRFLPSRQLFEELHRFLEDYLRRAARSPLAGAQTGQEVELVLRYFDRDLHYVVEPQRFTAIQDPQHRTTFRYELAFETVAEADRPEKATGFFGEVISRTAGALQHVNDLSESFPLASALLADLTGPAATLVRLFTEPLRIFRAATEQILQASTDLTALRRLPADLVLEAVRAAENLRLAVAEQVAFLTQAAREPVAATLSNLQIALDSQQQAAERLYLALRSTVLPVGVTGTAVGYQTHLVRAGESLEAIASRRLADPGRAGEIAELNGLAPPYLSNSGLPGTVRPGGWLLLPEDAGPDADGTAAGTSWGSDAALYGVDLQLAGDDLVAVSRGGAELDDLALRAGQDNVTDALQRRIATPLGGHALFPGLGIPEDSTTLGAWLLSWTVEQVQRDPRVADVTSPILTDAGDQADVELTVQLVGGQQTTLSGSTP